MTRFVPAPEVIDRYLAWLQTPDTVLVGGQAVAYWAEHLGVTDGRPSITTDIDFYGMRADVEEVSARLGSLPHRVRLAGFDDFSVNSGTIVLHPTEQFEALTVDYLHSVHGTSGSDLANRALELDAGAFKLRIIHPAILLESKVANLAAFTSKRDTFGVEQCRLSCAIVSAFVRRYVGYSNETRRAFLDLAERVGRLSRTDASHFVYHLFGIDVLSAVALDCVAPQEEFVTRRWPQLQTLAQERRLRFRSALPEPLTLAAVATRRFG